MIGWGDIVLNMVFPDSSEKSQFGGKVGIVQRVLPVYRAPFFDELAKHCPSGVAVFAGRPQPSEGIKVAESLDVARLYPAKNMHWGSVENSWYACWQRGVWDWFWKWQPDVVVIEAGVRVLSSWLARIAAKRRGCPVLGWGLGELPREGQALARTRHLMFQCVVRSFDGLIGYSSKACLDYIQAGVSPDQVFVAYNAVSHANTEALRKQLVERPESLEEWRRQLELDNRPIVLFVGRLLPQKRVDSLILACSPLANKIQLLIVGDGPERAHLEKLASTVHPQTRFLGHLSGLDLARCFYSCDLFVLPGTGGLSVQEAMTYSKPVLVADADGTEGDLVTPGVNGQLITPGDTRQLTTLLAILLEDEERLIRMGCESRHIVEEKINLDSMVDSFIQALKVVSARASTRD